MEKSYKSYIVWIVILAIIAIILISVSGRHNPAVSTEQDQNQMSAANACTRSGKYYDLNNGTCSAIPATSTSPVKEIQPTVKPPASAQKITYTPATAANTIHVASPLANTLVSAPFTLKGEAQGWYFEAVFPVVLKDASGNILAQTQAHAVADWMTDKFVPFEADLTYKHQPSGSRGTVTLMKDNPSGLPQNDASVSIPVIFQ